MAMDLSSGERRTAVPARGLLLARGAGMIDGPTWASTFSPGPCVAVAAHALAWVRQLDRSVLILQGPRIGVANRWGVRPVALARVT